MKFQIIGENIEVTEAIATKIESKLSNLTKYFVVKDDTIVRVVISVQKNHQKVEVTIPTQFAIFRAEEANSDLYVAIDLIISKLERQIRRLKTKLGRKGTKKIAESISFKTVEDEKEEDIIIKNKNVKLEEMSLDEAITKMELLDHNFFVYKDEETQNVSVVYKRHRGGYGLLDVELANDTSNLNLNKTLS